MTEKTKTDMDRNLALMIQEFKRLRDLGWHQEDSSNNYPEEAYIVAGSIARRYDKFQQQKRAQKEALGIVINLSEEKKRYLTELVPLVTRIKEFAAEAPAQPEYLLLGKLPKDSSGQDIKSYIVETVIKQLKATELMKMRSSKASSVQTVLNQSLFKFEPDQWLEYATDIKSIVTSVEKDKKGIPSYVIPRVRELFQVYVHGHWHSVIALARSILESCLIDRGEYLGIDIYDGRGMDRKRYSRLSVLKERLTDIDRFAHLDLDLNRVISRGNNVMHTKNDLTSGVSRKIAKQSIESLITVLETIYSEYSPDR